MTEKGKSCVEPAKGPLGVKQDQVVEPQQMEVPKMMARVGKPAPDFEANAYIKGEFKNVRLSEYNGQWVVLCFYPGDFTFV